MPHAASPPFGDGPSRRALSAPTERRGGGTPGVTACRSCGASLHDFVDLGMSPLCESFVAADARQMGETFYPLDVKICPCCWLGQLGQYVRPDHIFTEYAYYSSFSQSWLRHAERYVALATARFGLDGGSFVVEVASNDGYLLRNFVSRGIPCLGIEPARNVARAAEAVAVPTLAAFFGRDLARELSDRGRRADLVIGNNVLAQVPDLADFVAGLAVLLKPDGVLTLEIPHLARLIEGNQFDTIYHEHFSYFSLVSIEHLLADHGLRVFDVEELPSHGGSLRVFACRVGAHHACAPSVERLRHDETVAGVRELATYRRFQERVRETKRELLELLLGLKRDGARIAGYGAPGKGNTLLNHCGIGTDVLDFTVDRNPYKQGMYLPGSRVPIHAPDAIDRERPDYVMILPWNLTAEITAQLAHIASWGGRFIVPIPEPRILAHGQDLGVSGRSPRDADLASPPRIAFDSSHERHNR